MIKRVKARICQFFGGGGTHPCQPSKKGAESVVEAPKSEEYERCILCGELTCIPVSMPIDWRENYEIGCGQICAACAKKQREEAERKGTLSDVDILVAVKQSQRDDT